MLGALFNRLMTGGKAIVVGLGIYTTVRYFWDDSVSIFQERIKNRKVYDEINNIVLTQDDIQHYTKKYGKLNEFDLKRLKYHEIYTAKNIHYEQSKINVDKIYEIQREQEKKWKRRDD